MSMLRLLEHLFPVGDPKLTPRKDPHSLLLFRVIRRSSFGTMHGPKLAYGCKFLNEQHLLLGNTMTLLIHLLEKLSVR